MAENDSDIRYGPGIAALCFDGWEGYNQSLIGALDCTDDAQLVTRPSEDISTPGELLAHIAFGRVDWFARMGITAAQELQHKAGELMDSSSAAYQQLAADRSELKRWLEESWSMISECIAGWGAAELEFTYIQPYAGKQYVVPRQWVVFRIMAHDIHHGGQLSMILYQMGVVPPELGYHGGHITPLATLD